jgi:SAM-dependent methyltransferase
MSEGDLAAPAAPPDLSFLQVDAFLGTLVDARALKTAFELQLIDRLLAHGTQTIAELNANLDADASGLEFLLGLLAANRVVTRKGETVGLHPTFKDLLSYRDLLETKMDFAGFLLNDFADLFTSLIRDPAAFAGSARLFQLFDYRRGLEDKDDNYVRTRSWMRLTSTLTRYEASTALALHDFAQYSNMLDVGGNSGEFLLQACRRNPDLKGTVVDLPLVCEVGMEHVLGEEEHTRISFAKRDARRDPLPGGHDLITFKSMLHDWPESQALEFLDKAADALVPGGTILIFERLPLEFDGNTPPFSIIPILLFFRSYREPTVYIDHLKKRGFDQFERHEVDLDTRFQLLAAKRSSDNG